MAKSSEKAAAEQKLLDATTSAAPAPEGEPAVPVKRGRGRPKGSKNKPKDLALDPPVKVPKKRGRPVRGLFMFYGFVFSVPLPLPTFSHSYPTASVFYRLPIRRLHPLMLVVRQPHFFHGPPQLWRIPDTSGAFPAPLPHSNTSAAFPITLSRPRSTVLTIIHPRSPKPSHRLPRTKTRARARPETQTRTLRHRNGGVDGLARVWSNER
ncbi:hypothetical protein BD626DRAFT_65523 [Schizophyllum amplum]|uniref:Uncharacterized protein n=1 Tax=Schizophyllum amplum TaxID=97359 RepID=A0A550CAY9_9AGAR|nr:hypothetical protein BD626DRAFT_65523 [Auriculariopsis ampla]